MYAKVAKDKIINALKACIKNPPRTLRQSENTVVDTCGRYMYQVIVLYTLTNTMLSIIFNKTGKIKIHNLIKKFQLEMIF